MLQQTQVERVLPKYRGFLKKFPTARKLASARTANVVQEWQGLGYNRRALNLQKTAHALAERFLRDPRELEKLPGIGPYTARAVSVFAWNTKEVFLETNIRRVFIHFYFRGKQKVADRDILSLVEKTLYRKNPRMWYWALMDYGALALRGLPNPNRKSARYVRQSRFEGSRRYARAHTLQLVMASEKGVSENELTLFFKKDPHLKRYPPIDILRLLEKDGFIVRQKKRWILKN